MIWLAFTWLALIALWGTTERWHVAASGRRRLARLVAGLHHHDDARPFDQARR